MTTPEPLLARARALQLHGVVSHWAECAQAPWIAPLIEWEETERARRSLERRLRCAHIGRFKPLADFDWRWPEQCDQAAIAELMTLGFLETATNALLVGPSGLGKTTIAQNIAHQAVLRGVPRVRWRGGRRRLRHYASPTLLVIDEVGYLSYSNRHADLLFELISRRHEKKSTLITTNKSFAEWSEVFPNAACVVALIDRLVHHAEIIALKGPSWRHKEAQERAATNARKRKSARSPA